MKAPFFKRPTFHFPRPERGRSLAGSLFRGLLLLLLLAFSWLLLVLAMGIPSSWIRLIEQRLPDTPFAAEAGTVSYDLIRGVTLKDARIYYKGDAGLPLVAAETVRLAVNPLALLTGGDWLRDVWISGGSIRALEGGPAGKGTEKTDFGNWNVRVEVQDTRLFGARVVRGKAEAALSGAQLRVTRIQGEIGEEAGPRANLQGSLTMDLAARLYRASVNWNGDPLAIESFLTALGRPGALDYIRLFKPGARLPSGDAEMEGCYGDDWLFSLAFSGAARDCRYRGVEIRQLFMNLQFSTGAEKPTELAFDPVVLIRQDGLAAGGFSVDFTNGDVRFDGYSTCPPGVLVRLVAPDVAERLAAVRVEGPVRIHAGGTANARDRTRNAVTLFMEGQKLGMNRFLVDRLAFTARLTGTSCEIHDVAGEVYGGSFTGMVDLVTAWSPDGQLEQAQFAAQGGCQNTDGRMLAVALGSKTPDRYEGKLAVAGRVSGMLGAEDWKGLSGAGTVRVSQGRLFRLPVFGPLSDFLSRLVPGLDPRASLTDGTADWRLEDGRVKSESILVGGDKVSLSGRGSYALTNSLNYDIQLKLMNTDSLLGLAVRAITMPVSKLFELRLRGTPQAPHWYPVNFSSDVFERLSRGGKGAKAGAAPAEESARPEKGGPEP
jgi:hypothetical protein